MPVISGNTAVAANGTVANVLTGRRFERLPPDTDADISIYLTGSALGLEAEFFTGAESALERSAVSAANRMPQLEDLVADGIEGVGGDLLQLSVYNTTAGALTLFWRVEIEEVLEGEM